MNDTDIDLGAFAHQHGIAALLDHLGLDELGNEVVALHAEIYRLREAIAEHKQGNTNMSLTNLKLWEVLPPE
jgi:uncharacterized small protein (DUF1192 family)